MKILIVTGKLAEETIKEQTSDLKHQVDVLAFPVTVASFITPRYAAKQLEGVDVKQYDMIIMPGPVSGDLSVIEEATGVPTYRGPMHSADLPLIITEDIPLSKTIPANELVKDKLREKALAEIKNADTHWEEVLARDGGFLIGDLPVSSGLPMRVMGEIVNAPNLSLDEVAQRAIYFESQGADIIDIGMLAGNPQIESIPKIINTVRKAVDLPISIDTLNTEEIKTSINSGIDLILSLDTGNMDVIAPLISDESVVVLPTDMSRGYLPKTAEERVKTLAETIEKLTDIGVRKTIGDLVVEPLLKPGLMEGLKAYQMFHQKYPDALLLFGVGNAVELIDADSVGVHGTLVAIAREVGSSILHVPEYSVKARGSVAEAVAASQMVFLAEKRGTVLKDLGLDLLRLKDKRWKEEAYERSSEINARVIKGVGESEYHPDKTGWFKIQLDRENRQIIAIFYPSGSTEPGIIIKGENAREIYQTIIRERLISKHDHAAYLGKELEKAFIALRLGRSYVQDEPLF